MPYNTTAIPPRKEVTGQTQLPLSRVRKIIALDPDVAVCSSNAAFVITLATELFMQYLTTEAQNMTKLDRKLRRNLQYRDFANAVARIDRLEFLEDTIPNTVPFGKVKNDAAAAQAKLRRGGSGGDSVGGAVLGLNGTGRGSGGSGGGGSGSGSGGGPKASAGGSGGHGRGKSRSSAGAPTAISDLMADGMMDTDTDVLPAIAGRKRQQVLSFSILNNDADGAADDAADGTPLTFRSSGAGVAAAAALAQAAAASGAALDDADGPGEQLEQDMRRARDEDIGPDAASSLLSMASGARAGRSSTRHSHGDVDMRDR